MNYMNSVNTAFEAANQALGENPDTRGDVLIDDRDGKDLHVEVSGQLAVQVAAKLEGRPSTYQDHSPGHSLTEHEDTGGRVRVLRTEPIATTAVVKIFPSKTSKVA